MKFTSAKRLTLAAACVALCVVLPMAFHSFPNGGTVFLPMHIPVLLCGLMCSWPYGLICGVLGPALSCLITGMPPVAMLPAMVIECGAYGCISGLMMTFVHTRKTFLDLYISMTVAMLAGRVLSGLAKAFILTPGVSPFAWVTTSLVQGIPGIALQLVLLPLIVYALTRARLLPKRYPKETV